MCGRLSALDEQARPIIAELVTKLQAGELTEVLRDVNADGDLDEYFKEPEKTKKR